MQQFTELEELGLRISGLFKCSLEPVVEVIRSIGFLKKLNKLRLNLAEYCKV
jgi:hypothetical protein